MPVENNNQRVSATDGLTASKILTSYLAFSLGNLVSALISFSTLPVITYLLVPSELGKASIFLSVYSVSLIIIQFGMYHAYARYYYLYPIDQKSRLLWSSMTIPMGILLVSIAPLLALSTPISVLIAGSKDPKVAIMLAAALCTGLFQTFALQAVRMSKRGLKYSALLITQSGVNCIVTVVYAILRQNTYYALVWAQIVSNATTWLLGILQMRGLWFPVSLDLKIIKKNLPYATMLIFSGLAWWLLTWIDRLSLRAFSSFTEIGLYFAAAKVASIGNVIYTGFLNFWEPLAFEFYEKDKHDTNFLSQSLSIVTPLMFIVGIAIVLFKDIFFIIFAPRYKPASAVSPFLILVPVMSSVLLITERGIFFTEKTYWNLLVDFSATLLNLLGNILLVPLIAAKGAAISTGSTFIFLFSLKTIISKRLYPANYYMKDVFILTGIMVIVCLVDTFFPYSIVAYLFAACGLTGIILLSKDSLTSLADIIVTQLKQSRGRNIAEPYSK